ncbi:hypothetical protein RFI_12177 [Reticulomyxa filosa]|uniref:Uncharacterized protein n=1 Tax=Reticulomyxa filosa TaxID=46433 RepID=X6NI04_RETFI|nr:hypothetical protein RFI_12177 [Reticulomyxa filosa]|eukprot:ETO24972.1 hypothetical protein RFI_12177 [Reticulomyxa filosa]
MLIEGSDDEEMEEYIVMAGNNLLAQTDGRFNGNNKAKHGKIDAHANSNHADSKQSSVFDKNNKTKGETNKSFSNVQSSALSTANKLNQMKSMTTTEGPVINIIESHTANNVVDTEKKMYYFSNKLIEMLSMSEEKKMICVKTAEEMELDLDDDEESYNGGFPDTVPLRHLTVPVDNRETSLSPKSLDDESSIGNEARRIHEDVTREEGVSMEYEARPDSGPDEGRTSRPPSRRCSFLKDYKHPYLDKAVTGDTIEERGKLISQALNNAILRQQLKSSKTKPKKKLRRRESNSAAGNDLTFSTAKSNPYVRHHRTQTQPLISFEESRPMTSTALRKDTKGTNSVGHDASGVSNIDAAAVTLLQLQNQFQLNTKQRQEDRALKALQHKQKTKVDMFYKSTGNLSSGLLSRADLIKAKPPSDKRSNPSVTGNSPYFRNRYGEAQSLQAHEMNSATLPYSAKRNNPLSSNQTIEHVGRSKQNIHSLNQKRSSISQPASPKNLKLVLNTFAHKPLKPRKEVLFFSPLSDYGVILYTLLLIDNIFKPTPVDLDLDQMDAKLAEAVKSLEARVQRSGMINVLKDNTGKPRYDMQKNLDSNNVLNDNGLSSATKRENQNKSIPFNRPSLLQSSQSNKVISISAQQSRYFQRPPLSPIKFRSKYRLDPNANAAQRDHLPNDPHHPQSARSAYSHLSTSTDSNTPKELQKLKTNNNENTKPLAAKLPGPTHHLIGNDNIDEKDPSHKTTKLTLDIPVPMDEQLHPYDDSFSDNEDPDDDDVASPRSLNFSKKLQLL